MNITLHRAMQAVFIVLFIFLFLGSANLFAADAVPQATAMKEAAGAAGVMEQLNINTASVEALAKIPGVGPKLGEAIAAYRETNGAFKSIADLVNVEGIDSSLLEKIKPFLTL